MVEANFWSNFESKCPLDIKRIIRYSKTFESYIPNKIIIQNLDKMKENLFNARGSLDSMLTSLIQLLYDKDILKTQEDKVLYAWLVDNLGRFMKRLDEQEDYLLIKFDEPTSESRVGVSRIAAYIKILRVASDSLIYESLLKATEEYESIDEKKGNKKEETKRIKKEPRTFLYILFQVLQVTISILGGLTREKSLTKKGMVQTIPTSWQSLMGESGQKIIKEGYKEETGIDLSAFENDLESLNVEGDLDEDTESD